jgi:dihydrofolate synthase/folylpolyglutamate synthase
VAGPFASLGEALGWLDDHIDYERVVPTRRLLPSLSGVWEALALLGHPEQAYPVIHVTGTNGKGSTTAMISALLVELGLDVGTYTSPNLHRVNERIAHNEEPISDEVLCELLGRLALIEPALEERLTRFELLTVAALEHFSDVAVDVAVIEVGLGGTWDSTNVVEGKVCVLTNVDLDHVQVLGDTVAEIAVDKAGIIKPGSIVVLGAVTEEVSAVVESRCDEVGAAALWRDGDAFSSSANRLAFGGRVVDLSVPGASYSDVHIPLHGRHQGANAAVALAAVTAFLEGPPAPEVVEAGFARVLVPGRLEVLGHQPLVMVDGAHNPAGASALAQSLTEGFDVDGPMVAVVGMLAGREPRDLLAPLAEAGIATVICVEPGTPRALEARVIAKAAEELDMAAGVAEAIGDAVDAALALASTNGLVLVTGSLYVVGSARQRLLERAQPGSEGLGEVRGGRSEV